MIGLNVKKKQNKNVNTESEVLMPIAARVWHRITVSATL